MYIVDSITTPPSPEKKLSPSNSIGGVQPRLVSGVGEKRARRM